VLGAPLELPRIKLDCNTWVTRIVTRPAFSTTPRNYILGPAGYRVQEHWNAAASRDHPLCSQDDLGGKKNLKSLENLSQLEASETNARAA